MNRLDWQSAAKRIGCIDTQGYHCVPDKFHSSLIEFCYNKTRILVDKGMLFSLLLKIVDFKTFYIFKHPQCLWVANLTIMLHNPTDIKFDHFNLSMILNGFIK